jgi:hypothetical protein
MVANPAERNKGTNRKQCWVILCPIPIYDLPVVSSAAQPVQHAPNPFLVIAPLAPLLGAALPASADFNFHKFLFILAK